MVCVHIYVCTDAGKQGKEMRRQPQRQEILNWRNLHEGACAFDRCASTEAREGYLCIVAQLIASTEWKLDVVVEWLISGELEENNF